MARLNDRTGTRCGSDLAHDTGADALLSDLGVSRDDLPVAIWRGQQVLRNPPTSNSTRS